MRAVGDIVDAQLVIRPYRSGKGTPISCPEGKAVDVTVVEGDGYGMECRVDSQNGRVFQGSFFPGLRIHILSAIIIGPQGEACYIEGVCVIRHGELPGMDIGVPAYTPHHHIAFKRGPLGGACKGIASSVFRPVESLIACRDITPSIGGVSQGVTRCEIFEADDARKGNDGYEEEEDDG